MYFNTSHDKYAYIFHININVSTDKEISKTIYEKNI